MKSLSRVVLFLLLAMLAAAPLLTSYDATQSDLLNILAKPSLEHPLGTDELGRDVWSRLLFGGQRTLWISALATVIAVPSGVLIGALALANSRSMDAVSEALINTLLIFPPLLLALVILTLLGSSWTSLALATGLSQIAPIAQVTRGATMSVRHSGYVEAAISMGATRIQRFYRHILPNIRGVLLSYVIVIFAYNIINSAGLSLLGLGGDSSMPDWGVMLAEARNSFRYAPWIALAPGVMISLLIITLNDIAQQATMGSRE